MAILTGINTRMHGSVGDWTFKKTDGTIIVSQKVEKKKHPLRTTDNLPQRLRWANLARLFYVFRGHLRLSFEQKECLNSDFNTFMHYNVKKNAIYLPKDYIDQGGCVVNDYMVTKGTLQEIKVTGAAGAAKVTNIVLGEGFIINNSTTVKAFSDAVVKNNTEFLYGDQLSCYIIRQQQYSGGCPYVTVECYELLLDGTENGVRLREIVNEKGFSVSDGKLAASEAVTGGIVWVHSRKNTSRKSYVSTQCIVVDNPYVDTYSGADALTEALGTFNDLATNAFLMPGYGNGHSLPEGVTPVPPEPSPDPDPDPDPEPTTVTLTVTCSPANCGTLHVNDEEYTEPVEVESGKTVTLRFEPAAGYTFDRWSDNVREAEREVTLTEDTTLTVSCSED